MTLGISSTATRAESISELRSAPWKYEADLARVVAVDVEQRATLQKTGVSGKPDHDLVAQQRDHLLDVARVRRIDDGGARQSRSNAEKL